jgi:hypothetical protein
MTVTGCPFFSKVGTSTEVCVAYWELDQMEVAKYCRFDAVSKMTLGPPGVIPEIGYCADIGL